MKHFDSPEVTELLQFLAISMGILAQLFRENHRHLQTLLTPAAPAEGELGGGAYTFHRLAMLWPGLS